METQMLPLAALTLDAIGTSLAEPVDLKAGADEALAVVLMRTVRQAAETAAGQAVEVVSFSVDRAGAIDPDGADVRFTADVDRKTRTIVFAHGDVRQGGSDAPVILTATAVYRLPSTTA